MLLLSDLVDSLWASMWPRFDGKAFKSVTQGAPDLAEIPLLDAKAEAPPAAKRRGRGFHRVREDDARRRGLRRARLRPADRQRGLPGRLRAGGPDRSLEKLLAGSGKVMSAAKPVLEINPRHSLVVALAGLGDDDKAFKEDAAQLLLDEARVLDGERVADARAFSERLARLIGRGLDQRHKTTA